MHKSKSQTLPAHRQLLILLAILVPMALLGWAVIGRDSDETTAAAKERSRAPKSVVVAKAALQTLPVELEAFGTLRASQSVLLTTETSGRVSSLSFSGGQQIEAGAPLLTLDSDMQIANLDEARANLRQVELELQRAEDLKLRRAGSQQAVDTLRAAVAAARAALARAAKQHADRTLLAPFSGTTGLPQVTVGEYIDSDTVITSLDDLQSMTVDFEIPEASYSQVERGQTVAVKSTAYPDQQFNGKISEIDSRIDSASGTFNVRATLPNSDQQLRAGMWVQVRLQLSREPALMIPEESIVPRGIRAYVMLAEDGKAREAEVTIGRRIAGSVEITSGLEAGAPVIVRGHHRLRSGTAVSPHPPADGEEEGKAAARKSNT